MGVLRARSGAVRLFMGTFLRCAAAVLLVGGSGLAPERALADRGALSLEGGGIVSAARLPPPVGTGDSVSGTMGGALLGVRYALRNNLEVTLAGTWLSPVWFYHHGVSVPCAAGATCVGDMGSRVGRTTAAIGADYVTGLTFRLHVGAEAGWAAMTYERVTHTQAAVAPSRTVTGVLVTPRIGLEWAATDHLSFAITPRVDLLLSEKQIAYSVPFTASYSWYR
jgi:hypothetical protein